MSEISNSNDSHLTSNAPSTEPLDPQPRPKWSGSADGQGSACVYPFAGNISENSKVSLVRQLRLSAIIQYNLICPGCGESMSKSTTRANSTIRCSNSTCYSPIFRMTWSLLEVNS